MLDSRQHSRAIILRPTAVISADRPLLQAGSVCKLYERWRRVRLSSIQGLRSLSASRSNSLSGIVSDMQQASFNVGFRLTVRPMPRILRMRACQCCLRTASAEGVFMMTDCHRLRRRALPGHQKMRRRVGVRQRAVWPAAMGFRQGIRRGSRSPAQGACGRVWPQVRDTDVDVTSP